MAGGGGKGKGKGKKPNPAPKPGPGTQTDGNPHEGSGNPALTDPLKVISKENSIISSTTAVELRGRTPMIQPPCRPGFGNVGRQSIVSTNHAYIDISPSLRVRQYSISVKEEESKDPKKQTEPIKVVKNADGQDKPRNLSRRTLKEVIRVFLSRCRAQAVERGQPERAAFVTDFSEMLYNPYDCDTFENDGTIPPIKLWGKTYFVKVDYVKTLPLQDLFDYISTFGPFDAKLKNEHMQMLNVWLHHKSKEDQDLVVLGSKTFPVSERQIWEGKDLGGGLTAMRGIFASIRPTTGRILANIQVTHGTFFTPGPLHLLMEVCGNDYPALDRVLRLLKVKATHLTAKKKDESSSSQGKQPAGDDAVYKTIIGLARRDNEPRPPDCKRARVTSNVQLGAGAKNVEFWLEEKDVEGQPSKSKPRWISVWKYYREKYNLKVGSDRPVLNVGTHNKPLFMPVEVLEIPEGQFARLQLEPTQTQNMIRFAVQRPGSSRECVSRGRELIGHDPRSQQNPDPFGSIGELVNVEGRFLPHLKVTYDRQANLKSPLKPTWDVVDRKMSIGAMLSNWAIVFVSVNKQSAGTWGPSNNTQWDPVVKELAKEFKRMKVVASDYGKVVHWDLSSETDPSLKDRMAAMGAKPGPAGKVMPPKHLVVFLFNESAVLFSHIKRHGDVLCGVPTTCVCAKKIQDQKTGNRLQYMSNVALKVNLKGRGVNQKLPTTTPLTTTRSQGVPKMPMGGVVLPSRHKPGTSAAKPTFKPDPNFEKESFFEPFKSEQTMVVGIDVTHPAPGDSPLTPSVAGMVASVDHHLGQWPAILRAQKGKQEIVKELGFMLCTRLEVWWDKNRAYPRNILIYRDGVSEGQYMELIAKEYPQLREDCNTAYGKKGQPEPRITIVVAGKRHHTRFYPVQGPASSDQDTDKSENTRAGLVVDRGVTEVRNWEFYLQAHAAIQGTVRPVHYYVVHDDIFTSYHKGADAANQLESVTHQLSYLFGRATLAVSLCTPVYYAHLACERARVLLRHTRNDEQQEISDKMLEEMKTALRIHGTLRDTMYYI